VLRTRLVTTKYMLGDEIIPFNVDALHLPR
jgi:hypothetical protein